MELPRKHYAQLGDSILIWENKHLKKGVDSHIMHRAHCLTGFYRAVCSIQKGNKV